MLVAAPSEDLHDGATVQQILDWFPSVELWQAESVLDGESRGLKISTAQRSFSTKASAHRRRRLGHHVVATTFERAWLRLCSNNLLGSAETSGYQFLVTTV